MKKTITVCCCDICKKEMSESDLRKLNLPFITHCDWTEGRPTTARIEFEVVDICDDCLLESTNLVCDFQGLNKRKE